MGDYILSLIVIATKLDLYNDQYGNAILMVISPMQ